MKLGFKRASVLLAASVFYAAGTSAGAEEADRLAAQLQRLQARLDNLEAKERQKTNFITFPFEVRRALKPPG